MDLSEKVAFITGASRGIGLASAQILAKHGATVLLNSVLSADLLKQRASEIKEQFGTESEAFVFDAGDPIAVKDFYANLFKKYKRLDILINNAGIFEGALLSMVTMDKLERMFHTNVQSVILNMQYASRLMARNKSGSIVNVSSIMGRVGASGQVVYSGTKAAVIGMTSAAAKELAPLGIRVNAIAPGFIETDMVRQLPEDKYQEALKSIRMNRAGTPEDVANTVYFFASDLSSYVTGQVLGVDGGMLI